jgi:peptidoglycan/LPS O-acetylase OafA/YrhL
MLDRQNNLDIIRLIAALQVVLLHFNFHLQIDTSYEFWEYFLACIRPFPGVPIFFSISGFLIFASYERSPKAKKFFYNRFFRIYPLLFVFAVITAFMLLYFSWEFLKLNHLLVWFIGQITVFQFYTPDSLRSFGVGTPNGALWTIPVEIQFYLLVPLLYKLCKNNGNWVLLAIATLGYMLSLLIFSVDIPLIAKKLFKVSVLNYLPHFIIGIFIYLYIEKIKNVLIGKGHWWLLSYICFYIIFNKYLGLYNDLYSPNLIGLVAILLLSIAVFSLAFTKKDTSYKLLGYNDYSYGIYVIHMVVANVMIELTLLHNLTYLLYALLSTVLLAVLSWEIIEKPSLGFKNKPEIFNRALNYFA